MVIKKIKEAIEKIRQRIANENDEQNRLASYRESGQMQKAEQIKKEADRLAHLKQYKSAIEEYNKALEIYPINDTEQIFKKPAEFLFKVYYNIAASYSFLNKFSEAIDYFDKALKIENIDDENIVKAWMSKGNCYYKIKQLVKGDNEGAYRIRMESEFDVDEKTSETFQKIDEKEGLLKLACECFTKTIELERHNADAWYKKGHMEFLMGLVKDAMLSFDRVFEIQKDYENKEGIGLFEDIRMEKGIKAEHSIILDTEIKKFKTKTGHYVSNKAEKMIADFLFENNLVFQYNMAVSWADKDDFKANFFIPKLELYLEHFKFDKVKDYQKLMKLKIKQYEKNKKKLVYTASQDEGNIEEVLKIKLKPYIVL